MDIKRWFAVYYQVILAKRFIMNERTWLKEVFSCPTLLEFSCQDNLADTETKYQQNMVALFAE